jgi:hypothetical protein
MILKSASITTTAIVTATATVAVSIVGALISGCATPAPPANNLPTQVQVSFNMAPGDKPGAAKKVARGAISGAPQHVGFYYSVNPDCTSDGLVQTQLKSSPANGSVAFVKADGYSSFPSTSAGHECNSRKSPGVEVIYTSAKNFVGTDEFTVLGVGPHGKYMETDYTVKVIAP